MPITQSGGASNIGSTQIIDGAIVDADINAAAAIQITKLSGVAASGDNTDITGLTFLKTITVNLTSAQIKSLATVPVEIIPAPAAGKIHIVDEFVLSLTWVTPSYTAGQSLYLVYHGDTTILINSSMPTAVITTDADAVGRTIPIASKVFTVGIAKAVDISTAPEGVTQFASGNGTAKVFLRYRTITL